MSTAPADAGSAAPAGAFTHRQILTIFAGLMLGMFLAALDQTIVSTSIRTIADDLQGLSLQAWATTAYLITATITTPIYGKLSDLYGRKPFFLTAISIFVVGSLLCSFATSMYGLAVFRAVQGLGAGGLFALALAIIGDIVPPRQRARYQGYFLAVFGTSSVVGPLVGGFLADQESILGVTGWRWVFLVNVPIGLLALAVVARVLNLPHTPRHARIDWRGAVALAVGLVPLLVLAEQGRAWGWTSVAALGSLALGVGGLAAFLAIERRTGDDALLPLRLFRTSRVFSLASVAAVVIGMGMFGGIAVLPQYMQIVQGATPTEAGLLTIPLMLGIMAASIAGGQLTARTGRYKVLPVIGTALMVVGLLLFTRLGVDTPLWQAELAMLVFGLGLGGCMQPLILAVQNAVPPTDMGVATASATFFRQMGGTLGTAVLLSILFGTVTDRIAAAFRATVPTPEFQAALADPTVIGDPDARPVLDALANGGSGASAGVLEDSSFLSEIDPRLARPFLVGFADSIGTVFWVAAAIIAVAFVVVLFLPEVPLRTQSGVDAQASDRAAADEAADRAAADQAAPHAAADRAADQAATAAATAAPTSSPATPARTAAATRAGR